jgi:hypothetical protein
MNGNPKHWLVKEESTVTPDGKAITIYIVKCGKPGLPRRETSADLGAVTCPKCAALAPRSRLLRKA